MRKLCRQLNIKWLVIYKDIYFSSWVIQIRKLKQDIHFSSSKAKERFKLCTSDTDVGDRKGKQALSHSAGGESVSTYFLEGNLAKGLRSLKSTDTSFRNSTSKHLCSNNCMSDACTRMFVCG